jgi:hypothetical protein
MRRLGARLYPSLVVLAACSPKSASAPVPLEDSTKSMLLAVVGGERPELYAIAVDPSRSIPFDLARRESLFALLYDRTLTELQIEPGSVALLAADAPASRTLPTPRRALRLLDAPAVHWEVQAAIDPALSAVAISAVDLRRCISSGGCVVDSGRICAATCPEPGAPIAPAAAAAPADPEPPRIAPCPLTWSAIEEEPPSAGGVPLVVCAPPALPGRVDCAEGQAQMLGEASCAPVGPDCPSGDYAPDLPANAIHVRAGASGGDGSIASPFGRIEDALAVAIRGSTIGLSRGTFAVGDTIAVGDGASVEGACSSGTTISSARTDRSVVAQMDGGRLRRLRIRGGRHGVESWGASAGLAEVILEDAAEDGWYIVSGAMTAAADVLIQRSGRAAIAVDHARLEARRLALVHSRGAGIAVFGGPSRFENLVVWDVAPVDNPSFAPLIDVSDGGSIDLSSADLDGGIDGLDIRAGGRATLADVAIAHVGAGNGIHVEGTRLEARRIVLRGGGKDAVVINQATASATIADVAIRPGGDSPGGTFVRGLVVLESATASVSRAWIDGTVHSALAISSSRRVDLTDAAIERSGGSDDWLAPINDRANVRFVRTVFRGAPSGCKGILIDSSSRLSIADAFMSGIATSTAGAALYLDRQAHVDAARIAFSGNNRHASAHQEGTELSISDGFFGSTVGQGTGIAVAFATVELDRALFDGISGIGIALEPPRATVQGADVTLRNIRLPQDVPAAPSAAIDVRGSGLSLSRVAIADIERSAISIGHNLSCVEQVPSARLEDLSIARARNGIFAHGLARISVERAVIDDVVGFGFMGSESAAATFAELEIRGSSRDGEMKSGTGVLVIDGAAFEAHRFVLSGHPTAGLLLSQLNRAVRCDARDPGAALAEGLITNNGVGIRIDSTSFDENRLLEGVIVRGNTMGDFEIE